jgi:hypothetical protein
VFLFNILFFYVNIYSNTFHTLQPSFLPGFTFSWLQLISHRFFMPKLLVADGQKVLLFVFCRKRVWFDVIVAVRVGHSFKDSW